MTQKRMVLVLMVLVATLLGASPVAAESASSRSIVGLIYEDQNLDGVYGLGNSGLEPSVASVRVSLYLDNAPFSVLGAEDELFAAESSDVQGYVIFRSIPTGTYLLHVDVPSGYITMMGTAQPVNINSEASGTPLAWTFGLAKRSQLSSRIMMPLVSGR